MMQTSLVSLAFASSAIWDTDYALEMARFNQLQILSRAGLCLQALANSRPQGVLDLLYG
jgi:flagellin-like hook-associated protein FlgL